MMGHIGNTKILIKDLAALFETETINGKCFETEHRINEKINAIEASYFNMLPFETIMSLKKNCSNSRFFEVLSEQTRNAGIKAQKNLAILHKKRVSILESKIETLRENFDNNFESIHDFEKELAVLRDSEVRDKLMDLKIFEILNAERASPHFLNIARKTNSSDSLGSIRNSEGKEMSKTELTEYLTNFYQSLYRSDPAVQGEIEDFLGADILNHPMVRGSILTGQEKANLDRELDITEFDKALTEANLKSAPGMDGFSYKFITEFWNIYRTPTVFVCKKFT
jgi:hypothetical protein